MTDNRRQRVEEKAELFVIGLRGMRHLKSESGRRHIGQSKKPPTNIYHTDILLSKVIQSVFFCGHSYKNAEGGMTEADDR